MIINKKRLGFFSFVLYLTSYRWSFTLKKKCCCLSSSSTIPLEAMCCLSSVSVCSLSLCVLGLFACSVELRTSCSGGLSGSTSLAISTDVSTYVMWATQQASEETFFALLSANPPRLAKAGKLSLVLSQLQKKRLKSLVWLCHNSWYLKCGPWTHGSELKSKNFRSWLVELIDAQFVWQFDNSCHQWLDSRFELF